MGQRFLQLGGAFGAEQALREMVASRLMAEAEQRKLQQQEIENSMRMRQIDQGDRRIRIDQDSLGLQRDQFELSKAPKPQGPMSLGANQRLVDPSSGRILVPEVAEQPKPAGPMNLGPGAIVVDPTTGRIIVRNPAASTKDPEADLDLYRRKKEIDAQYGGTKPSIGAEKNALAFFNRMLEAERNTRAVEGKQSGWDVGVAAMAPQALQTWLQSPEGQMATQAQRTFTEARLRKESGAAIPQSEYDTDRTTNFRVPGESKETSAQKRRSRLTTMRGLGTQAGRALQEYYGDKSLDDILSEFNEPAAAVPMVAPDGRSLMVPAEKVAELEAKGAKRR